MRVGKVWLKRWKMCFKALGENIKLILPNYLQISGWAVSIKRRRVVPERCAPITKIGDESDEVKSGGVFIIQKWECKRCRIIELLYHQALDLAIQLTLIYITWMGRIYFRHSPFSWLVKQRATHTIFPFYTKFKRFNKIKCIQRIFNNSYSYSI